MDGQCFSEELEESATIHLPSLCLNSPGVSQSHSSVEQSQVWYTQLLKLVVADPVLIPPFASLLVNPDGYQHLRCQNLTLNLATWKISDKVFLNKAYQAKLLPCLKVTDVQAYNSITKRAGESLVAVANQGKLISFLQL